MLLLKLVNKDYQLIYFI